MKKSGLSGNGPAEVFRIHTGLSILKILLLDRIKHLYITLGSSQLVISVLTPVSLFGNERL